MMKSCWNFVPEERPTFTLLVTTISQQLPEKRFEKKGSDDNEFYLSVN